MGKTPKHQGHKSSRPYNARNELVHKSVSGSKKLTQESHRSASADYVARKISTNHGSQHLRLPNQSYLFGVSKGYQDTTKVSSLKLKHSSREQNRGLARKKRSVHSQGTHKSRMQEEDLPKSSHPQDKTENGENEKYKNEDEVPMTDPPAELNDVYVESTLSSQEANDLKNDFEEVPTVSPKGKTQKQTIKEKSQKRKEISDNDELLPSNESAELSSTEESLHPTPEIVEVVADSHASKEDCEDEQENTEECNELSSDCLIESNNIPSEDVALGNKTLRISLVPVDETPFSSLESTHKEQDDSGEMGKLSLSCSSSEFSLSSTETEPVENECVDPILTDVEPSNCRILTDPPCSFGNSLRSISARRPMRGSSVGLDRSGFTLRTSSGLDENEFAKKNAINEKLCPMPGTIEQHLERNIPSSVKRKAVEVGVSIETKKAKLDLSHTYGFFSIMSTPLQILRSKISNERVASATVTENGSEEDCINQDDMLKTVNTNIKAKDGSALPTDSAENAKQDVSSYKSWCNIM